MATKSSIEWTDATWNPTVGCSRVSEGCRNCYAEKVARRMAAIAESQHLKHLADKSVPDATDRMSKYTAVVKYKAGKPLAQWNGNVELVESALQEPLHWKTPRRVFVDSESDLFHKDVPFEFVAQVFGIMDACFVTEWGKPRAGGHTFQILTKRPERAAEFYKWLDEQSKGVEPNGPRWSRQATYCNLIARRRDAGFNGSTASSLASGRWPLPNVWLGTSVENQPTADERIPHLLKCPAAVRFLSCEPLLGPIDFGNLLRGWANDGTTACITCGYPACCRGRCDNPGIHWLIAGGESGPGARPCNVEWIRSIVEQCKAANVPCFVKQLGSRPIESCSEPLTGKPFTDGSTRPMFNVKHPKGGDPAEWPEDLRVREFPNVKESV